MRQRGRPPEEKLMAEVRSRNERSGVVPDAAVWSPGNDGPPAARSARCPAE